VTVVRAWIQLKFDVKDSYDKVNFLPMISGVIGREIKRNQMCTVKEKDDISVNL